MGTVEMELNNDDYIVIVVDENGDSKNRIDNIVEEIEIKKEQGHDQYVTLQELLQYAPIYELNKVKEEPIEYLDDCKDEDFIDDDDNEYRPTSDQESDNQMSDDENALRRVSKIPKPTTTGKDRRRAPNPALWESKVAELCKKNPKLKTDKDALILELVILMRSVKAPKLNFDCYIETNNGIYRCKVCGSKRTTKPSSERHYLEKHGPRYLICYACGGDFRSTTNLYKHEKCCPAPDAPMVLRARAAYVGNKARGRPFINKYSKFKIVRTKPRFNCSLCVKSFMSKPALVSHERLHRDERPFQCHVCARSYTSNAVLTKHMWTHRSANFVCHHCGRAFTNKTALIAHIYTHSAPRFPCEECPQRFMYKAALQLHVHRKHRKLPHPFACQLCPKRYGRMSVLKDHMKKVHGMLLMSTATFFKQLPIISEHDISQAKVVLKSQVPIINPSQTDKQEQLLPFQELLVKQEEKVKNQSDMSNKDNIVQGLEDKSVKEEGSNSVLEDSDDDFKVVVIDDDDISHLDYETIKRQLKASDHLPLINNNVSNLGNKVIRHPNKASKKLPLVDNHRVSNLDNKAIKQQQKAPKNLTLIDNNNKGNTNSLLKTNCSISNEDDYIVQKLDDSDKERDKDVESVCNLDNKSKKGKIKDKMSLLKTNHSIANEDYIVVPVLEEESNIKGDDDSQSFLQDYEDDIKVVFLDDSDDITNIDYEAIREQYEASENKDNTIFVVENGIIKQLSEEKFKEMHEILVGI